LMYKNLIINKFMYKSMPNQIFDILRRLIIDEKYWIYSKIDLNIKSKTSSKTKI